MGFARSLVLTSTETETEDMDVESKKPCSMVMFNTTFSTHTRHG